MKLFFTLMLLGLLSTQHYARAQDLDHSEQPGSSGSRVHNEWPSTSFRPYDDASDPRSRIVRSLLPPADSSKVTALVFWATYCAPCKAELPKLVDLGKKYSCLQVVPANLYDYPDADFKKHNSKIWNLVTATPARQNEVSTWRSLGLNAIPHGFVMDDSGKHIADEGNDILSSLEAKLKQKCPPPKKKWHF